MSQNFSLRETRAEVHVEWRIERFLSMTEDPKHNLLQSPAFSFSDAQWFIGILMLADPGDYSDRRMTLYIKKRFSTSNIHTVKYTLGIRNRDGSVYKSIDSEKNFQKFSESGKFKFIRLSELRQVESLLTADGTFTVFVTIRLVEPSIPNKVKLFDIHKEFSFQATQTDEVSLVWKVQDFISLPRDDDFSLMSPIFPVAGASWCMEVYPNGNECDPGWVDLSLSRETSSSENRTFAYTLGILKRDGTPHRLFHYEMEFNSDTFGGCFYFIKRSELLDPKNELISEGTLTFFCTVRANPSPLTTAAVAERDTQASSDASHDERTSLTTPSERYEPSQSASEALCKNCSAGDGREIFSTWLSWITRS